MGFGARLSLLLLCIGIALYFNSEKSRFNKMQEKAYVDKDERAIGQYGEKANFYVNALAIMFFVIFIMFIFFISGNF
jgi:hypothetical protein